MSESRTISESYNMEVPSTVTNKRLEKALRKPDLSTPFTSITIDGVTILDLIPIGTTIWFEYHCWESPDSSDAEIWYRSHQQVTVIGVADCEPIAYTSLVERGESGMVFVYHVRFSDGLEWDVFEDELCSTPDHFCNPDPPKREDTKNG